MFLSTFSKLVLNLFQYTHALFGWPVYNLRQWAAELLWVDYTANLPAYLLVHPVRLRHFCGLVATFFSLNFRV